MSQFFQIQLRTSDVDAARRFYQAVLGARELDVFPLHEQAVARGARPHWLGHLEVADVDRASAAFAERGATPLGPKWVNPAGLEAAVMRDPGGAVVALSKPAADAARSATGLTWHLLHTAEVERAKTNYGELFGWEFKQPLELGELGVFHPFSWRPGGEAVGSFTDVAARSGVHPHWLFHFSAARLEPVLHAITAGGGTTMPPTTLPSGPRVAVCEDPQGAAFALYERSS